MSLSREITLPPYRFWETRSGAGTPVVLIHGLGGSGDWWRRNIGVLAGEHLVATVDLVGFGKNRFFARPSKLPLAFADVASLLARWIESSFDGPVHLVGNSMGGHVAIYVTAMRPDLVRSLTLVDSTGIPFDFAPRAHFEHLVVPRGALSFTHILARDAFRSGPTSLAVALARIMRDDATPLIREIRVPVLLIWGEHDPLVPLAYGERMRELMPQAKMVVIPKAGHIPMWENATVFNDALTAFLRGVDETKPATGNRQPSTSFSWPIAGWTDGIAHRESGRRRDIVLLHGLGMSSAYLGKLAKALFERGWNPIAPDLRGFGESANAPSMTPEEHAHLLVEWADALEIRDAVWLGHSNGCNVVAHVASMRPDLVRRVICIGPLWTKRRHPVPHLAAALFTDVFREPARLFAYVLAAYWRAGLGRWWMTFWRSLPDLAACTLPPNGEFIIGERDPIPDRDVFEKRDLTIVPGAHACLFSNPDGVAELLTSRA